ncbi:MAG: 1-acyl-sn-glycerol-3-phosphate acyltransferase [Gammaproteobacteria bacterium]|nr:1-acyl-sn-glycerol-3-phosphate acyltransferase [Gammaproteobacteria bacterium]
MKAWIARWLIRLWGWRVEGERPESRRFVLIAAPHTSNWDLPGMLLFAAAFDIKVTWMAKHNLFFPPLGWLLRALGGVPIVRHENRDVVASMVAAFDDRSDLILVVPTEGTRLRVDYWKSGFYHIACGARIPIVPSFLDYGQKRGGFGPALHPSGNVSADMQTLREFYAPMSGKYPGQFGPVRLREEGE